MKLLGIGFALLLVLSPVAQAGEGGSGQAENALSGFWRGVVRLLQPAAPAPQHLAVEAETGFELGSADAPLTLVAYTDYRCPFCARFEAETFPALHARYIASGKMRYIARDLPLHSHPLALLAAQSAHCAGDQGKFWEMKALLLRDRTRLEGAQLAEHARGLALDGEVFARCMAEGKHLPEIGGIADDARARGITRTPTFVLGKLAGDSVQGIVIVGAQPLAVFETAIDAMLEQR